MSDKWIFFPCQMGVHRASIFYDHGIRDSIDAIAPPQLLNVQVTIKQPQPNGLPNNEEFSSLCALEDDLISLVKRNDSFYVGRVTVDGNREYYIYTHDSELAWAERLEMLAASHDYVVKLVVRQDENHDGYWKELFPTPDDWQVIKDMQVLESLEEHGDDGTASRRIDHWAYFPTPLAAAQFSTWAIEQGYTIDENYTLDDGSFRVCFAHEGTIRLDDISSHTIKIRRMASELGGEYDGFETPVCAPSDEPRAGVNEDSDRC